MATGRGGGGGGGGGGHKMGAGPGGDAAASAALAQQALSQESMERIYKFTRFPRDKEAVLKPSLGVPGFDPAPLDETESYPETLNTANASGYVAPPPKVGDEFGSFLGDALNFDLDAVQDLQDRVNTMFDDWEEERAKEVVYRMDGLNKFFQSLVATENEQDIDRFFERVVSDEESFVQFIESANKIPVRQMGRGPQGQRALSRDVSSRGLSPVHTGWWVRLTYLKAHEPSSRTGFAQTWNPSRDDAEKSKLLWTNLLCDFITRTLSEIAEPRQRTEKRPLGLNRNAGQKKVRVTSISAGQLTSRNMLNESKLEQFEQLWSLARAHLEAGLILGEGFLHYMVLQVMLRMHMEAHNYSHFKWKGPLPLFVCYIFVSKLVRLAPYMSEHVLRDFWKLCTLNLKTLFWSKAADFAVEHDVAFEPYADLLQGAIRFVALATPPETFRSWENDVQAPPGARTPSGSGSAYRSSSGGGGGGSKNSDGEKGAAPMWWVLEPAAAKSPIGNGGAGGLNGPSAAGDRIGTGPSVSPVGSQTASAGVSNPGAAAGQHLAGQRQTRDEVFPLCTLAGKVKAEEARLPSPPPVGIATAASVRSAQPGSVTLNFAARKRGRKRARDEVDRKLDPWLKFELIPNTPSLHYLLRGARKVRRPTLHPTQFGIMRSSSLQSTTSSMGESMR